MSSRQTSGLKTLATSERRRAVVGGLDLVAQVAQEIGDALGGVLVVVDDEDALAARVRGRLRADGRRGPAGRYHLERCPAGRERKLDDELAPLARPVAVRRHLTAVQLDEAAHDRQAETEAALRAVERLRLLEEEVEHPPQHLGGDADPLVADAQARPRPRRARR